MRVTRLEEWRGFSKKSSAPLDRASSEASPSANEVMTAILMPG
jgi:hypothetical protein